MMRIGRAGDLSRRPGEARRRFTIDTFPTTCIIPLLLLMLGCFVWPLFAALLGSLHPHSTTGVTSGQWTLANYHRLLDPFYLGILWRTLRISLLVSLLSAVLAYPVAWYAAGLRPARQAYLLMVFVSPWLVNVAVKAFGWTLLLGSTGIINRTLRALGLIDAPLHLMLNETGVVIGLLHAHFMFVLLPLWAALNGLDRRLLAAAASLGAGNVAIWREVILPLTRPALISGVIINFMLNVAAFATPALLGGSRVQLLSTLAYRVNLIDLNWEFGAAIAVAMLVITTVLVALARRLGGLTGEAMS